MNPCINCGKERINGKSWTEKVGNNEIIHTQTVCPDPACQKVVDKIIADRKAKTAMLTEERAKAKSAREKLAASN